MKSDKDLERAIQAAKEPKFPMLRMLLIMGLYLGVLRVLSQYKVGNDWGILGGIALLAVILLAAVALLLTVFIGWDGWKTIRVYRGVSKRGPVDITHLRTPSSPTVQPIIESLTELNFQRLGEAWSKTHAGEGVTWILTNASATVTAEVCVFDSDAGVRFGTVYADEAVVETSYPFGEHIETTSFCSYTITTSVQDAYKRHLEQVDEFSKGHGVLSPVNQMSVWLSHDAVYRARYAKRKMRRLLWIGIVQLAALVLSLVGLFMFFVLHWTEPSQELVTQRYWALAFLLVLAGLISILVTSLDNRIAGKSSREIHEAPTNAT